MGLERVRFQLNEWKITEKEKFPETLTTNIYVCVTIFIYKRYIYWYISLNSQTHRHIHISTCIKEKNNGRKNYTLEKIYKSK